MKFIKKPIVIEANQFTGEIQSGLHFEQQYPGRVRFEPTEEDMFGFLFIKTLEGEMKANPMDWIIEGINGEIYPCKPDIFEKTYEEVN